MWSQCNKKQSDEGAISQQEEEQPGDGQVTTPVFYLLNGPVLYIKDSWESELLEISMGLIV